MPFLAWIIIEKHAVAWFLWSERVKQSDKNRKGLEKTTVHTGRCTMGTEFPKWQYKWWWWPLETSTVATSCPTKNIIHELHQDACIQNQQICGKTRELKWKVTVCMSLCTCCSSLSTAAVFKLWYTINHCRVVSTFSHPGFKSQPIYHQMWKKFFMFSIVPLGKFTSICLHNSKLCNFRPTKAPHLDDEDEEEDDDDDDWTNKLGCIQTQITSQSGLSGAPSSSEPTQRTTRQKWMTKQYKEVMLCYYYAVAKKTEGDVTKGTFTVGRNRNADTFASMNSNTLAHQRWLHNYKDIKLREYVLLLNFKYSISQTTRHAWQSDAF